VRGLEGKRVLITGGSKGIGLAAARRFLEEGCAVVICGRDQGALDEAAAGLKDAGTCHVIRCDVSDREAVDRTVAETVRLIGGLDVLVNNAGIFIPGDAVDLVDDTWAKVIAVNLSGAFYAARAAARVMIAQGRGGAIVNVSSVNALPGSPESVPYDASKGGVLAMNLSLASELAKHGIRCNSVCPGLIWTPMVQAGGPREEQQKWADRHTLMKRVGEAHEIAAAIAFLASDEASYATGSHLVVDGGQLAKM
jgi:NAD(P)-dependent dehydrogenase (short-subunit alcohol dehydrogenase family)